MTVRGDESNVVTGAFRSLAGVAADTIANSSDNRALRMSIWSAKAAVQVSRGHFFHLGLNPDPFSVSEGLRPRSFPDTFMACGGHRVSLALTPSHWGRSQMLGPEKHLCGQALPGGQSYKGLGKGPS